MGARGRAASTGVLRRLRWRAEAAAFSVSSAALGAASPRGRLAIGSTLGHAFWAIDARHRRAAERSIRLAYGGALAGPDVRRLARHSMRHFMRMIVETAAFQRAGADEAAGRIRAEGLDHLSAALQRGRGLIGFSGHFGNWELLRLVAAHHGMASSAVARPLDNPLLEERLARLRVRTGGRVLPKRGGVMAALTCLRQGGFVTILIDQRPERSGLAVPFFGRQAFAADALALLALRTGAPIVPGFGFLDPDGTWRVVIEPEVGVVRTGDLRADSERIMADCTAILERWVRRYPEQWLWTHARLKA
ncbi:MAG: lysophospholipid acyltransferase family protein [Vicinamibacterales bacterium]